MSDLFRAAEQGDVALVGRLLAEGAHLTTRWHGSLALLAALNGGHAAVGHAAVVQQLLAAGVQPGKMCGSSASPLVLAARRGDAEVAQLLLTAGAPVDELDGPSRRTALTAAAVGGHEATARLLLAAGADVDGAYQPGAAPLTLAIQNRRTAVAHLLLTAGADVNGAGKPGSPLELAVEDGDGALVQRLLAAGADVSGRLLDSAVASGSVDVVRHVMAAGARSMQPPLATAARYGHTMVAELLLAEGHAVDETSDISHETALMVAADWGQESMVRLLLTAGADVNARKSYGWSALDHAATGGHTGIIRLLLEAGADKVGHALRRAVRNRTWCARADRGFEALLPALLEQTRQPLTSEQWEYMPPCHARFILGTYLRQPHLVEYAAEAVQRLPPSDAARLRTALLCLKRAGRDVPTPLVHRVLSIALT